MGRTEYTDAEYARFPVGQRVAVTTKWADFMPMTPGQRGTVIRNSRSYYGIIVRLDNWACNDGQDWWNFKPDQLTPIYEVLS